jgi:hypothetical protein
VGALVSGVGVARNTESAAGDWNRFLTERSQLQFDVSWVKVRYDQPSGVNDSAYNLVDYRYVSGGPTFAYSINELDTFKSPGQRRPVPIARWHHRKQVREPAGGLRASFERNLDLSINAGYSQSTNSEKVLNELLYYFYGIVEYETASSKQDGTVYSATVTRQGERVT